MVTYDFTLHSRVLWPHYMILRVCWDGLETHSFGLSRHFHGHGSWAHVWSGPEAWLGKKGVNLQTKLPQCEAKIRLARHTCPTLNILLKVRTRAKPKAFGPPPVWLLTFSSATALWLIDLIAHLEFSSFFRNSHPPQLGKWSENLVQVFFELFNSPLSHSYDGRKSYYITYKAPFVDTCSMNWSPIYNRPRIAVSSTNKHTTILKYFSLTTRIMRTMCVTHLKIIKGRRFPCTAYLPNFYEPSPSLKIKFPF